MISQKLLVFGISIQPTSYSLFTHEFSNSKKLTKTIFYLLSSSNKVQPSHEEKFVCFPCEKSTNLFLQHSSRLESMGNICCLCGSKASDTNSTSSSSSSISSPSSSAPGTTFFHLLSYVIYFTVYLRFMFSFICLSQEEVLVVGLREPFKHEGLI